METFLPSTMTGTSRFPPENESIVCSFEGSFFTSRYSTSYDLAAKSSRAFVV